MKKTYPTLSTPHKEGGYFVFVPDIGIYIQGKDMSDAMFMARDSISRWVPIFKLGIKRPPNNHQNSVGYTDIILNAETNALEETE